MADPAGILYVAIGEQFVHEAIASAESVRRFHQQIPIALMTDVPPAPVPRTGLFTMLRHIDGHAGNRTHCVKIDAMRQSPFDSTLFLDTDTRICAPIADLFILQDRCDIAMAHTPRRVTFKSNTAIPDWFPEPNSGVVWYANKLRVQMLLESWRMQYDKLFRDEAYYNDQISLRAALWEHRSITWHALPPEYNCRTVVPQFVCGTVRIIHGRADLQAQERELSKHQGMRIWLPRHGILDRKELQL